MTELNPYESPKALPTGAPAGPSTKRTLGFLTLAVLTPVAVFFTGCISCLAVGPTVDAVGSYSRNRMVYDPQSPSDGPYTLLIVVGFAVFLIPPIIVLIVMCRWALVTYYREALERNKKLKDATP